TGRERRAHLDQPVAELGLELLPLSRLRPPGLARAYASERRLGGLGVGGGHERQACGQGQEMTALHDILREAGGEARSLPPRALIERRYVTTGRPRGTTGESAGTTGQLLTGASASKRWR